MLLIVSNSNSSENCWFLAITKRRARFVAFVISASLLLTPSVRMLLHVQLLHTGEAGSSWTSRSNMELSLTATINKWSNTSFLMQKLLTNARFQAEDRIPTLAVLGSAATVVNMSESALWTSESFNYSELRKYFPAGGSISKQLLANDLLDDVGSEQLSGELMGAECRMREDTLGFWNVLDALLYSALPACLLVLLDAIIVLRLRRALRARPTPEFTSMEEAPPMQTRGVPLELSNYNHHQQQQQQLQRQQHPSRRQVLGKRREQRRPQASESLLIACDTSQERLAHAELIAPLGKNHNLRSYRSASLTSAGAGQSTHESQTSIAGAVRLLRRNLTSGSGGASLNDLHLTLVLLVPSVAFLVLTLPISSGHAVQWIIGEQNMFQAVAPEVFMMLFAIAELLAYSQHALNFYLCVLTSGSFRRATWRCVTRSRLYYWLLVGAHRVRSLFFRKCCCFRLRSRHALPVIRFQWFPTNMPHFRGAAARIEANPRTQYPMLTSHLLQANAPPARHFFYNPREQLFSSLNAFSSWVRQPNSGALAAGGEQSGLQSGIRPQAHFQIHNQPQLVCICICRHSSSCTVSSQAYRGGVALSTSSNSWRTNSMLPSGGFNVCSEPGASEFPIHFEAFSSRNRDATV